MPRALNRFRVWRYALAIVAAGVLGVSVAHADVASDQPAAILVFPKVVVDITSPQISPPAKIDTLIRVSNTSNRPILMQCFYVDATPACGTDLTQSCVSSPIACTPPTMCQTKWNETDFVVYLTPFQPVAWLASRGATQCQPGDTSGLPCFPLAPPTGIAGSLVPPTGRDPFLGELKCIAVNQNFVPVDRNDLKGEAEIIRSGAGSVDVESYNAVGIPAFPTRVNSDATLVLGGACIGGRNDGSPCAGPSDCPNCTTGASCPNGTQGVCPAEYSGCPSLLVLDHFFDGAPDPVSGFTVTTDLTLVPCSEDFSGQVPTTTTVQFLVFNEFEQRLSTSTPVTCFQEFKISDIDAPVRRNVLRDKSIFSAAVMGTLTGQTRMRGVPDGHTDHGNTLLGIAEEFRQGGGTAAVNVHFQGTRPQSDFIRLPDLP